MATFAEKWPRDTIKFSHKSTMNADWNFIKGKRGVESGGNVGRGPSNTSLQFAYISPLSLSLNPVSASPVLFFPLSASLLFIKPKHSSTRLPLFLAQHRRAGNVPHEAGCVPSLLSCFWVLLTISVTSTSRRASLSASTAGHLRQPPASTCHRQTS